MSRLWTKYVTSEAADFWAGPGEPDDKGELDLEDDVAHLTWNGRWRIATAEECEELISSCTVTETENYNGSGVAGWILASKKEGYTDKSIFIPNAGYREGNTVIGDEYSCLFWTSSIFRGTPSWAGRMTLESVTMGLFPLDRCWGLPVRPVTE